MLTAHPSPPEANLNLSANPIDPESIDQRTLQRSIALVIKQSRLGLVTVALLTMALGGIFVPAVGWAQYLVWAAGVIGGFALRQVWFESLRLSPERSTPLQLTLVTGVSAATGWIVVLSLPIFGAALPRDELVLLSGLLLAWMAAAVSLLGVTPPVYGVYLVVCLITVFFTLAQYGSTHDIGILGFAMVMGGLMMYRVAKGIRALLDEAVSEGSRSQALAAQLDDALAQQQTAYGTRSRFLAAASHDLKQPVQAMTLLVNVLKRTQSDDRRQQVMDEIEQANASIEGMFSGLLDMASIDAGSMTAHVSPLQIDPLLKAVLAGFPQRCEQKGLQFSYQSARAALVMADTLLLKRVVSNLLENALKYCEAGSITLTTSVSGDQLIITIADSGMGMDAAEMTQMYEAFVRGPSAQALGVPGLGLGLSIARHMCDLMGILLEIESVKDKGTTARIGLALAQGETSKPMAITPAPNLKGLQIMVLEDDALAKTAMVHWLQEAGASVTQASNGPELWRHLEATPSLQPDLVIADHNLGPGREIGPVVIAQLRQKYPELKALLVTGETNRFSVTNEDSVLTKPVSSDGLSKALVELQREANRTR